MPGADPTPLFAFQLLWFLVAWAVVARLLVAPRLEGHDTDEVLALWTAPQLFRVLGLGLLVPSLAPEMPPAFALPTALGDTTTALLALATLLALRAGWRHARRLAWVTHGFGLLDLAVALVGAVRHQAAHHLAAQWYVPALVVPLMLVCHVQALSVLRRARAARS